MTSGSKNVVFFGASGHAMVLAPIVKGQGFELVAAIDTNPNLSSFDAAIPLFRSIDEMFEKLTNSPTHFCIAIGGARGEDRIKIHQQFLQKGLQPLSLTHHRAWVADSATLGAGSQVLAMSAVCEFAKIGQQTIVNTNASIDHETTVGDGCHIMPGATIAGCCVIENFVTIGSNATILPRIKIGAGAIIGAGATVTKNVEAGTTVVGTPAQKINRK